MEPLTHVRDISRIAYGFMASKALFASLNLELFSRLSGQSKTLQALTQETAVTPNRLRTLLTACVSLGLIIKDGENYRNAPASEAYLVPGAPSYFGDYYRFQIDRQIYPQLTQLDAALQGDNVRPLYDLMADEGEAEHFSRAQHAGSLGPAAVMAKMVDLTGCRQLLDVAGGSGAFSITFCQRYPEMSATILDFPHVIEVAKRYVTEAGFEHQIDYIAGSATEVVWPGEQDVVLMSYLLSGVSETDISACLAHAFRSLKPGGQVILHDFMIQDDHSGPTSAALWFLPLLFNPGAVSLTPGWLSALLHQAGFRDISVQDLLPGLTKLVLAKKPPRR
ncbi:MAG: methyltransferase [bacterium]|nr:methyltransferase [bacterium]